MTDRNCGSCLKPNGRLCSIGYCHRYDGGLTYNEMIEFMYQREKAAADREQVAMQAAMECANWQASVPYGCICPPGAETTCKGNMCPRRELLGFQL